VNLSFSDPVTTAHVKQAYNYFQMESGTEEAMQILWQYSITKSYVASTDAAQRKKDFIDAQVSVSNFVCFLFFLCL
jgi:hypothetical protein